MCMNPLLSRLSGKTYSVATSTKFSRSHNNYGFNFYTEVGNARIYYHAPKVENLPKGKYFLCYEASSLVEGRQDAISVFSDKVFQELVVDEVTKVPLNSELESLLASHYEMPQLAADAVLKQVQALLMQDEYTQLTVVLKNAEQLGISTAHTVVNLYQGEITTFDAFYADVHQGGISASLTTELNRRAANTLFAQFDDLEAGIEESKSRGILATEIKALAAKAIMECPSKAAKLGLETLSYVAESTTFQPTNEQFEQLFAVLDIERAQAIAKYLPDEAISSFPDYVKLSQLLGYLQLDEVDAHERILDVLFQRLTLMFKAASPTPLEGVSANELRSVLCKANTEAIATEYFSEPTADKAILLNGLYTHHVHAPVIRSSIYQLILRFAECGFADLVKCFDAELVETLIDEKLVQQISKNYGVFLSCLDNGQQALCEHFPLEEFQHYAQYASEDRFIQFLMQFGDGCSASELANLNKAALQNDFHQALLLVALLEQKVTRGGASVETIVSIFAFFQKIIFEYHAKTRSKLKLSIFPSCAKAKALGRDSSTLTVCEGKLWYLKNVDEKGNVLSETPKTLCRRSDCKHCVFQGMEELEYSAKDYRYGNIPLPPRQHSFGTTHFYQMVNALFSITAEQLHAHEKYVKAVSALNRWNDILDRLVCQCGEPLHISEHSPHAMGNMAVGATYWHCGNEACSEFCKSVKVSYCIGCQKVIDNRVDIHSCTPFEVKSFKKFYICVDCGSCCLTHKGFSGMCAHCGRDHAYSLVSDRANSTCRYCNTKVSMNPFSFKALQEHRSSGGVFNKYQTLSTNSTSHLLLCHPNLSSPLVIDIPQEENKLFVFDLFYALSTGILNREMLSRYQQGDVYDLKVMERMATLGLGHAKYGKQLNTGLLEHIDNLSEGVAFSEVKQVIFERVGFLFQQMTNQDLWHHYNDVEYPFTLALAYLTRDGIRLDKNYLQNQFQALELERNKLVKALQDMGIDAPTLPNVEGYLESKYSTTIASDLIAYLQRSNSKSLSHVDPIFPYLSGIEKVERGSAILSQMSKLPSYIKPQYQIVGTVTGRCTAKEPNLLGLPGALRHVIRAELGMSIVECDYKQMEIGVLAALSGDQQLISDFNTGDVYEKFGTALAVSREQAKVVLLGLIYGMSASTIAIQLGVTNVIAETYINRFFARYPDVKKYQNELVTQGTNQGYVTSCTGLRRSANRDVEKSSSILNWEKNWFKNFPIQASAAAVFKLSIVELARELHGEQFKLLVPHYDAIVFEVPENQTNHYTAQVKAAMHRAMKKQFPILEPQIDVKSCGKSWGEQIQEVNTSDLYQRQGIDDLPF